MRRPRTPTLLSRNSWLWWAGSLAGATTALCAHTDLLRRAFPALTPSAQAQIELAAFALAWVSGHAAWSPLPLRRDEAPSALVGLPTPPDLSPVDPARFRVGPANS